MITFRKLDGNHGLLNDQSSLEVWYAKVRDVPSDEFTIGDICRSCRQELFLEAIIPIALRILDHDFDSGDLYDGELISALIGIPMDYWSQHIDEVSHLRDVCQKFIAYFDDDIKSKIEVFLRQVNLEAIAP